MKGILFVSVMFYLLSALQLHSQNTDNSSFCINSKEKELLILINNYRKSKKLPAIALSPELTKVAKIHSRDLEANHPDKGKCNMHSWSAKGAWSPCCYTDDHKNAAKMWSKPSELTKYKSEGYEIAYKSSDIAIPLDALDTWKKSPGHNDVIIEKGVFDKMKWKAIGISVEGNYALVWFGAIQDTEKELDECE